jgi:hypothetical protein
VGYEIMIVINKKSSRRYSKKNILYSQNNDSEEPPDLNKIQLNSQLNSSSYDIEIGWFLKEEFPKVCATLRETIKDITDFIIEPKRYSLEDDEDNPRVNFKSTNELLVGYLILEGWNITTSELHIKFNYQGKPAIKTQIQNNPLKLEQIQSIFYYCSEALEQFDDTLSAYTSDEIDLDVSNKILDVVLNKLRSAKDQLLKPNNVSFESNLQNKKIFKPNLPNDVIVELKVKNSAIVITSALIQATNNNSKEKKSGTPKNLRNSLTSSKSFFSRRHNQYFEILEQNNVECKPKKLEALCTLIQNAYSMALSCKEKNIVLQSLIFDK